MALAYLTIGRDVPAWVSAPARTGAHGGTVDTTTPAARVREERPVTREELAMAYVRVACVDYGFVATMAAMATLTNDH